MSDVDNLIALLRNDEKAEKAERKSNDCIDWMTAHWRLFAKNRRTFDTGLKQCGAQFPYSPDGLSEALGLDERLRFAKISFNDIPAQLLKPIGSKMLELFAGELRKSEGECALMIIAGDRTLVVTNMQTTFVPGCMHMFIKANEGEADIHVIGWKDLQVRLPNIFDHTGDTND